MTHDLSRLDAVTQATLVVRGEVSALELVDAAIARIEALEPQVHALASYAFDAARERARTPTPGPLSGVPFLIKDLLSYPGQRCAFGSRLFRANVASAGSPYTERLDAAGLITLGKTTTSEFGLLGSTETLLCGVTHNPWNLTRSAMGSSGGSAAAVASGMVPMAHASDGGGSIRLPASVCGLFGFKPSRGRCVSTGQPDLHGLISEHCISRSVRDSALLLALTEDPGSPPGAPVGYVERPLERPLRIGCYTATLMGREPDAEVLASVQFAARLCSELGHDVVEAPAPALNGPALSEAFFTAAGASLLDLVQMMQSLLGCPVGEHDLEPFTLALIAWYRSLPPGALERAQTAFAQAAQAMHAYLEDYDVVLCPTLPTEPPALGTLAPTLDREVIIRRTETLAGYTPIHNIAGLPAMSVPLFWSASGLPLGSHFAAPAGADATLLGLAYQLEAAAPWPDRRPSL